MKLARILVLAVVATLVVSTAASAHVRQGMKTVGAAAVAVVAGDEGTPSDATSGSPSPSDTSPTTGPSDSAAPVPETSDTGAPTPATTDTAAPVLEPRNHGEAVSAVAQDKTAVATKTLPNGKTVTNHGQAVSAVAKSDAGKNGGHGHSGPQGNQD